MLQDGATIRPHHVVLVGLLSGLVFVLALVALVTYIVRHA
jgi:flagellar biogenesis protein FliO